MIHFRLIAQYDIYYKDNSSRYWHVCHGGLIATNALTAAFADSNTSGDQVIKQLNKAKVYQKAKNTANQGNGISLASPISASPNTAASSQTSTVAQGNTNTGSNNGGNQSNSALCGIAAIATLISC